MGRVHYGGFKMKLKNNMKTYTMILFTFTMLYGGIAIINTSHATNGMPERVLSGEFGNRIFLLDCLFATLDGFECEDIHVSASASNYVVHGWNSLAQKGMGAGLPSTFQLYVDGEEVNLNRFNNAFKDDEGNSGVVWNYYTVFEPGSFSEGSHSILGVWTAKDIGAFYAPTDLVVWP